VAKRDAAKVVALTSIRTAANELKLRNTKEMVDVGVSCEGTYMALTSIRTAANELKLRNTKEMVDVRVSCEGTYMAETWFYIVKLCYIFYVSRHSITRYSTTFQAVPQIVPRWCKYC